MRHLKTKKKFKRTEEERNRLWRDLATALINNGTILTFTARAKWFRPKFDRLVTLVKSANGNKQLAFTKVRPFLSEKVARKLIEEIVPAMDKRSGGYTIQVKVFQEFSSHDKSIVKLADEAKAAALETAQQSADQVEAVDPETTEKMPKKASSKKSTEKKRTKKAKNPNSI